VVWASKLPKNPAIKARLKNSKKEFLCNNLLEAPMVLRIAACFSLCLKLSCTVAINKKIEETTVKPKINLKASETLEMIPCISAISSVKEIIETVGNLLRNSDEKFSLSGGTKKEVI